MKLQARVHQFFAHYLPSIKGVSPNTIKSYRDTFRLFLPFMADYYGIKIRSLRVEQLSSKLILAFLDDLEDGRKNLARTRNQRLAVIKSFAKMIRFKYPELQDTAETIMSIPQKRTQKPLIGFLYQEEILKVFQSVDLKKKEGFRDYALLHLLYDSGARASEITNLNLDYLNPQQNTLAILGKGERFRLIELKPKTVQLMNRYINKYRIKPLPLYKDRIFINQRGGELTRHGIYRLCKKYLSMTLNQKRLRTINPVHSFRHSRAVDMLYSGYSITDIKNHLGHDNIQSTTIYLHLDINRKRNIQKQFIRHMESVLSDENNMDELLQWESKEDIIAWLDDL
jgi:integrase/recombinase XerD